MDGPANPDRARVRERGLRPLDQLGDRAFGRDSILQPDELLQIALRSQRQHGPSVSTVVSTVGLTAQLVDSHVTLLPHKSGTIEDLLWPVGDDNDDSAAC